MSLRLRLRHVRRAALKVAPQLLQLASFLENAGRAREYGVFEKDAPENNALSDYFECLYPVKSLSSEIRRVVLSEDDIADDASPELKRIRRSILQSGEKIHSQLTKMVNSSYASYLQESLITIRDDRYCLPVRAEYKGSGPGMVHDQSSSGSTLFSSFLWESRSSGRGHSDIMMDSLQPSSPAASFRFR